MDIGPLRKLFGGPASIVLEGPNRSFCLKKRGQGLKRVRAIIVLALRQTGVLWAPLRDSRVFTSAPPVTQTV